MNERAYKEHVKMNKAKHCSIANVTKMARSQCLNKKFDMLHCVCLRSLFSFVVFLHVNEYFGLKLISLSCVFWRCILFQMRSLLEVKQWKPIPSKSSRQQKKFLSNTTLLVFHNFVDCSFFSDFDEKEQVNKMNQGLLTLQEQP